VPRLDLSEDEATTLTWAVETALHDLRVELVHTDDRELKRGLRERLDRLEGIAGRVAAWPTGRRAEVSESSLDPRRAERLADPDAAEEEAEAQLASDRRIVRPEARESNPDTAEEEAERLLAADQQDEDRAPSGGPTGGALKKNG
jgi:hypothetical protein